MPLSPARLRLLKILRTAALVLCGGVVALSVTFLIAARDEAPPDLSAALAQLPPVPPELPAGQKDCTTLLTEFFPEDDSYRRMSPAERARSRKEDDEVAKMQKGAAFAEDVVRGGCRSRRV
ncbi:MAG: hypothetical protein LBR07_05090 [Puniceicoccales bacterium]|jgi:hypothetical protein|nr:hypothetical protein [Puniceicoccales bacterium]